LRGRSSGWERPEPQQRLRTIGVQGHPAVWIATLELRRELIE
jgi:hypothetical protein